MSTKLKWGLLGTGHIATEFAEQISASRTGQLVAVGSRTAETAVAFTRRFPAKAHATYDAVLADPEVEAVYISTPHPMHAEWAIRAAAAGKHILCEKPLTMNLREAESVVEAARRHDVFLQEAFMYRCHPQTARLVQLIGSGVIGRVHLLHANFSFRSYQGPQQRLLNRDLGGGAILDVGCYPVSMARLLAGAVAGQSFAEPDEVLGAAFFHAETGVDENSLAVLKFRSGLGAQLACGFRVNTEPTLRIWGTEGSLIVPEPWHPGRKGQPFSKIIVFKEGVPEEIVVKNERPLFALLIDHVADHLAARQSPAMPWEDTLGNARTLDRWRESIGLRYPADESSPSSS